MVKRIEESDGKEITKKQFEKYEEVRKSGVTNMFMVSDVSELSGLNRETILKIMKNYDALNKKWPEVRGR